MNWLYYLLEANLYLAIFYGLYRLFLNNETFYELNRYYLIASSVIAFVLPVIQIGYLNQLLSGNYHRKLDYINPELTDIKSNGYDMLGIDQVIIAIYVVIAMAFLIKLGHNLYGVFRMALTAKKRREGNIVYIELNNSHTAFSFFNLLFINPVIDKKETILKHEMVHIKQIHSIDILFFELVQILCWFNPIIFLLKKDIKLLHEYIADHITTKSEVPKHDYAMFLIQNSFGNTPCQLTSQIFNQSILKRRINMLNKERSSGRARLRLLYVIPVAGVILCASNLAFTKEYAVIDLYELKGQSPASAVQQAGQQEKNYFFVKDSDKRLLVLNGKKISRKGVITIEGFDKMSVLNAKTATEKYGNLGKNGAVEFIGANTLATNKFPPPIVKKDVPPPPVPPAPPVPPKKAGSKSLKKEQVKFPPPIVKVDNLHDVPPPPPVEPAPARKKFKTIKKDIKFPPPIVTPDKYQETPPPPPVEPPANKKKSETTKEG